MSCVWGLREMWYSQLLLMFNFYWDWKWVIEELGTLFKQYLKAIPFCSCEIYSRLWKESSSHHTN